jgi:crossover junction endodeoxyribonuclease RusA
MPNHPSEQPQGPLTFHIPGRPAAKGSMRHVGKGRLIPMSKHLAAWEAAIITAARAAAGPGWEPYDGPLAVHADFYLPRPKTTRYPDYPAGTPDLDKLERALGDPLKTAGVYTDDARIVAWHATKNWAVGCEPGCTITIHPRGQL